MQKCEREGERAKRKKKKVTAFMFETKIEFQLRHSQKVPDAVVFKRV
jgi:hypothetical protein